MNEPIRQHLVPRCYLQHFALNKKKTWVIDAYDVISNKYLLGVGIDNVCVKRDYYTFKNLPDENKRFLEQFYGSTVESDYPKIYQALIDPKHTKISDNFRFKIISYILSQYWRTSKLTATFNNFWNSTIEQAYALMEQYSPERKIQTGDSTIDFTNMTLAEYKSKSDNNNREAINLEGYYRFKDLALKRLNDGIMVSKVHFKHRFITSDNPVNVSNMIYNPSSFIRLPIDSQHMVSIVPFDNEKLFDNKTISRVNLDEKASYFQTTTFNFAQFGQVERFVLGHKSHIDEVLDQRQNLDQEKFAGQVEDHVKELQANLELLKKARNR